MTSLCPGYRHVQKFGEDDEYEEEVVEYVTLDLGSNVDKSLLPNTSEYRLIGLDTDTPMLQLSGTFFKGAHEELLGNEILFTDGRDESDLSRKFVVPIATTDKRIKFEAVEVTEKKAISQDAEEEDKTTKKTQQKARESTRGRGGRGRGRGKGGGEGPLQHEYGETVMDLDVAGV